MLGKLIDYSVQEEKITINFEKGQAFIEIINSSMLNFFVPRYREEKRSKAVEDLKYEECDYEVSLKDSELTIKTSDIVVKIYDDFKVDIYDKNSNILCEDYRGERKPFERRGNSAEIAEAEGHKIAVDTEFKVVLAKKMEEDMCFYGLGERPGALNEKGYHYINWNTDDPTPHGETYTKLYKSIPFLINLNNKGAFGIFFDNTFQCHIDLGNENSEYYYFGAVDGNLDYYFIYGPSVSEVVKGYTNITGTTPVPQKWTLGYHQSRWSYSPESRLWEIANTFREKDIPCDTIHLDIDYMDDFRVFTWDKKRFKDPKKMTEDLKKKGFKLVTIIDPGVKKDKGYKIYDEGIENKYFATDKDDVVYSNWVWPGHSVFPNFTSTEVRKWWANNQKIMTDYGVSGIWNDMNEPASFNGPIPDDVIFDEDGLKVQHKEIHNVYGHLMSKATYEGLKEATGKRPFVITRACYSGTQKYSTVWTGDNHSTWEHLRMSLPMLMNLGLSGISFAGADVGGFGSDSNGELLSRWTQVGAFTPLFRNHSAIHTRDQEPWAFDKVTEDVVRKYIKLRYRLLPYFYDAMWQGENTGAPLMRPLLFHYQQDKNTYNISDEVLIGENILLAPIVEKGREHRMIYLPKGDNWIDFWTGEEHKGGNYIIKYAPIDICPIFIKGGTVIPSYEEQNYVGEKEIDTLKLNVYPSENKTNTRYNHFQDDGETFKYRDGVYNHYKIEVINNNDLSMIINTEKSNYSRKYKFAEIIIHNIKAKEVIVNEKEVDFKVEENSTIIVISLDLNKEIEIKVR